MLRLTFEIRPMVCCTRKMPAPSFFPAHRLTFNLSVKRIGMFAPFFPGNFYTIQHLKISFARFNDKLDEVGILRFTRPYLCPSLDGFGGAEAVTRRRGLNMAELSPAEQPAKTLGELQVGPEMRVPALTELN